MLYLILSIVILLLIYKFKQYRINRANKRKGLQGEISVIQQLKTLNNNDYFVVNDLTISSNGKQSQIDHIVVSRYGIFVIETKNYKGWITGKEEDYYWQQTINRRKRKFYNPVLQNKGHILALKSVLRKYPFVKFYSIIAFTERAKINVYTHTDVVYVDQIPELIAYYSENNISDKITWEIYNLLRNIKQNKPYLSPTSSTDFKSSKTCPQCKGTLQERNGKYGVFYGCSNYPTCKYIEK